MENPLVRAIFRFLNRYFMVPMFRMGFGPFMGNPFSGYVMVLKTTGKKTGKVRFAPVNYTIMDGSIYCLSGWGEVSHWYRNLRAQPKIEVILPSGPVAGTAEEVDDPTLSLQITRRILKGAGFAGFFLGGNPLTMSDEMLREKTNGLPVIRIRPTGIGSGAADPGGWLWLLGLAALLLVVLRKNLPGCRRS